jgi:WD40 repeat protein
LWASLEPVMRCCDDDGARRLLGDVVCALDVCRRSACVDGGGGWLAVSSAGEMSAASALVRSLSDYTEVVTCVVVGCMDSSGRRCLVSGSEGPLRVWDVDTFVCIHELRGHSEWVTCLSDVFVGGDGRHMVASGSWDDSVRVWDVGSGTCARVLEGHWRRVNGLSSMFVDTAGRRCVASASADESIRVWDVDAGVSVGVMTGHQGEVACVSVVGSVDGRQLLASGSQDRTVRLWDVASLECVRVMVVEGIGDHGCEYGHSRSVRCISSGFLDDSGRVLVASGSDDRSLRLWDVRTGECVRELSGHSDWVASVSSGINVDGRRLLASVSCDGPLRLWDVASGECVGVVSVPGGAVRALSEGFNSGIGGSVDRVLVATGSADGAVRVWDVRSILRSQSSRASDRCITATCISNSFVGQVSGRCVVALGCDDRRGSVSLWDVDSGECVRVMTGHRGDVTCLSSAFIASGRQLLASGSTDTMVRVWDVGSGERHRVLTGHHGSVMSVSSGFVDGSGHVLIASGSSDTTVRLWGLESGECVRVLRGHSGCALCVSECFSDSSGRRFIASGSDDTTVRVWDVDTGECARVLWGHSDWVRSVSSGIVDGSVRLASASNDRTIRVWDAVTGECVHELKGHSGWVSYVTGGFVDGSGRHCIASTASDGTVRVWGVSTGVAVSVVSLNEEMGFSCRRDADRISIVCNGGRVRLAVVIRGRLNILEEQVQPTL